MDQVRAAIPQTWHPSLRFALEQLLANRNGVRHPWIGRRLTSLAAVSIIKCIATIYGVA
jgi:hypothetical protein